METYDSQLSTYNYKAIWRVAYPIMLSLLMEQLIGITDTAFLGRVGEIELGASAVAGIYYTVIFMLGFGFTIGSQILMARRNGEGNYAQIGDIFWQGIYFLTALFAVVFILSRIYSSDILGFLISSPRVGKAADTYIGWRMYGMLFSFTAVMFRAFYVGTTQTRVLTMNSMLLVVSNIVFDWVLIFGKFVLPALGIAGAAMASSLAGLVSALFFIVYTVRNVDCRKYGLSHIPRLELYQLRQILRISVWTMIQNFVSIANWFLFFLFIERLGERPLAVANIIRSISSVPFMVMMAFASSCSSLVSNSIGSGRMDEVKPLIRRHIWLCASIVVPVVCLFALFPNAVLSIYTDMADLREASVAALWVLCTTFIVMIPGNMFFHAVSGTGDTRAAFLLELSALAIYFVYIYIIVLVMRSDVAVCWTADHVYGLCLWLASMYFIYRGNWHKKRI